MKTYTCPNCGAAVTFLSSVTAYAVCPYCRTMMVRTDEGVQKIGDMAQLPEDMSPFQLGCEGSFAGAHFTIIGRLKIGWADGDWNEWCLMMDDARKGWLAEAQGFYAPCFDISDELDAETKTAVAALGKRVGAPNEQLAVNNAALGEFLRLGQANYKIVDIKAATCIGAEGELPLKTPQGRETVSVDLLRDGGDFASIEFSDEGARVFRGRYVEWQELACSNYRVFEGW